MYLIKMSLRRMPLTRLIILLIAMSLILYLFYDFMSYQSKPQKEVLVKGVQDTIRYHKDKTGTKEQINLHKETGRTHLKDDNENDKLEPDENSVGKVDSKSKEKTVRTDLKDDKKNDKLESDEKSVGKADDKSKEKFVRNDVKTSVGQKDNRNNNTVEEHEDVHEDNVESKSAEKESDNNNDKTSAKYTPNGSVAVLEKSINKKVDAYRKALHFEEHLKDTNVTFTRVINRARYMSRLNNNLKIVLLSFVCKTCLPFVNSWLCNTKEFGIHKSVLLIVKDLKLKHAILTTWPDVTVATMQPNLSMGEFTDTRRNKITLFLGRLQLINALLHANVNLLLFDIKSVWYENPLPTVQQCLNGAVDILVNIIPRSHLNTGFLALFATDKTQLFWKELYGRMRNIVYRWKKGNQQTSLDLNEYYEDNLAKMISDRYEAVTIRQLPIHAFTDGVWYMLSKEERVKSRPVVIRNDLIDVSKMSRKKGDSVLRTIFKTARHSTARLLFHKYHELLPYRGDENKIKRAKQWAHWFLKDDNTCNTDLVRKTVRL